MKNIQAIGGTLQKLRPKNAPFNHHPFSSIILYMKPNCNKCKHYFITFDPSTPRGCRAFQIKSKEMPSSVVKQAGGNECLGFSPKETKPQPKDLKDSRYW